MNRQLATPFALAVLLLLGLSLISQPARAQLSVDITRGFVEPLPIAVSSFHALDGESVTAGSDIAGVITSNLESSGLFEPLDQRAFIQEPASLHAGPRFADWRLINAEALVSGTVDLQEDGRMRVEFRLWDVLAEEQLVGLAYTTSPSNWRRIAHIISDEVYERLTGEGGYFDTRVVYIAESGPQNRRVKRLAIMDQDGENHRYLTDGSTLVLTPRFSPTRQEITFMSYEGDRPRVYLFNLNTGQREVLGEFPGMTFAPNFSPDGNRVIFSMSAGGNTDIYTLDLRTRSTARLTNNPSIDTSPSYSPDGRRIVFNSDRGGGQQLYVMDAQGGNTQRISFGDGRYATPVWSPRGDLIAFTRMHQGNFYVGVMRPDGSGERMISRGYLVEGPTWAPNGRVLSFFRQEPADSSGQVRSRLVTVDVTGFNERELPTPMDASDPTWSPLQSLPGAS